MPGFLGKFAAAAIATAGVLQPAEPTGPAAIMEALVFGFDMAPPSRTAGLPADVQRSLARYRARVRMFRPTIERPPDLHGPEGSLYYKRIGVERAIFALFDRPEIVKLADEYARQADLFYEWEGFADSPISEAASADSFLVRHPGSPIAPYVQLFAGHRKLCAVSGLEGLDPRSDQGHQIAREADRQLAQARDAGHPLIRSVAQYLLTTRKCFER
jgi:hypothetical protein